MGESRTVDWIAVPGFGFVDALLLSETARGRYTHVSPPNSMLRLISGCAVVL
jgi:hypothetical protein